MGPMGSQSPPFPCTPLVYSSSQGCHTAAGTHMPQEITQCYLPPGRGDIPALTPAEAGTRLSTLKCYLLCECCWCCSYGGLDVRRKNATRESTSTLKAWLYEHIKNPYPTKGEKIMLAIITKMTLTQVTTYLGQVVHTHVPTCRLSSPR